MEFARVSRLWSLKCSPASAAAAQGGHLLRQAGRDGEREREGKKRNVGMLGCMELERVNDLAQLLAWCM